MLRSLARPIWHRRHRIMGGIKRTGVIVIRGLRLIPMPERARLLAMDVFFLSIEHLILNTNMHQRWRRSRMGTERLHRLMKPEAKEEERLAPAPAAPTDALFDALPVSARRAGSMVHDATVDVVLPVYKGFDETLNAIYRAVATTGTTPFELIVLNDASPDPQIAARLRELASAKWFTLIENQQNLGFVQTVNKGMQIHGDRDVVLLNSDTEVFGDWLDRLYAHAYSDNAVGTVTPLSNNAEICSYPYMVHDNNMALEVDYATLDTLAAGINKGRACELPTAVGFCMYIKRRCLRDVGTFDAETFGRGYGEENDFCLRATARDWKHLLAGDVFVRHIGGTSFSAEKSALVKKGLKKLNARYPHYAAAVRDFIRRDPAQPIRQRLDLARLWHAGKDSNILMVNHSRGGGTERHVRELCTALEADHIGSYLLQPSVQDGCQLQLSHYGVPHAPNLQFSLEYDRDRWFEAMLELGISHVHIHHLIGFPHRILDFLMELTSALGIRYDVMLHDYFTVDPRINLVDEDDFYTGEPPIEACEQLIERTHSQAEGMPVWQWRLHYARLLRGARQVFVPDQDVKTRMLTYVEDAQYVVRPHAETFQDAPLLSRPAPAKDEVLQVAIIGAVSSIKGSNVVAALARDAQARHLPMHFTIIGHTSHVEMSDGGMPNVTVTGEYKEEDIEGLLRQHQPHLVLIPSVWPETYCYTLSIALRHGLFPVVFDLGAQARRVKALGFGHVAPLALAKDPAALNDLLRQLVSAPHTVKRPSDQTYASVARDYFNYEPLWNEKASKQIVAKSGAPEAPVMPTANNDTDRQLLLAAGQ